MSGPTNLADRHIVITGANTGIGRVTAEELARRGARLTLLGRSARSSQPVVDGICDAGGQARFVECQLGDLASVRAGVQRLLELAEPIHVLINNAGVAGQRGQTTDGFELHFGINHISHFALTLGLRPLLEAAQRARVVTVASHSHYKPKSLDLGAVQRFTKTISGLPEYGDSKLANVLFSRELHRRWHDIGVSTFALHPGVIKSDVWRRIPQPARWLFTRNMKTVEEGAQTSLFCATEPGLEQRSGLYWSSSKEREASQLGRDDELAARLWERSQAWITPS